ncbi:MAG: hypothetical protein NVS4B11_07650 [Ktedonobacteraceae bacterium]
MAQTANNGNKTTQKLYRPGQRQQERLQRIARRKRRQQIILSIIVALVLIVLGSIGFWQYQVYTNHQHDLAVAATSTSTAKANVKSTAQANASATAGTQASATSVAQAVGTAYAGSPTPSAGPATPPKVTQAATKLPDGLQEIDIKVGSGAVAQAGSTVTVEYTGWLQSTGKKFDSSFDHGGQPFDVTPLGKAQVIPGWNEGLVGMKVGGTRRLIIPAALGYGSQANGPIPANSVLIFDITVVAVK